jgi:hypothetical protein
MTSPRKRRSPVDRIMAGMIRCVVARGEAGWWAGFWAGRADDYDWHYDKEQRWPLVDPEERRFKRLVQRVLRAAAPTRVVTRASDPTVDRRITTNRPYPHQKGATSGATKTEAV